MTKAAELAKMGEVLTNSQIGGRRNIIINGAMNVAQRSTSVTGIGASAGYFTCDRWKTEIGTTAGRFTMSQTADGPNGVSANCLKLDCTTADTSIAAGEYLFLANNIEGQDLQGIGKGVTGAKQVTLSFYVKANAAFNFVVEFHDRDNDRTNGRIFTTTTDWVRHEITFQADTTGAFDDDNAASARINFWLHAGSTYTGGTLATDWANKVQANRAAGIDSFFSSTDNNFFLTGVQLEVGSQATPFEHRSFAEELALCRRYCYVINGDLSESAGSTWGTGHMRAGNAAYCHLYFPVPMRTYPTSVTVSDVADFQIVTYGISNNPCTTIAIQEVNERAVLLNLVVSDSSFTIGDGAVFTISDLTNGQIIFEGAEL
jgi:hypothetical protein